MPPAILNITAAEQVGKLRPTFDHGLLEQEIDPCAWGAAPERVRNRQIGRQA